MTQTSRANRYRLLTYFSCGHSRLFTSKPKKGSHVYCTSCDTGVTVTPPPIPEQRTA